MISNETLGITLIIGNLLLFYFAFKKSWVDNQIRLAAQFGIILGFFGVILTKIVYYPIESYLGGSLLTLINTRQSWWKLLVITVFIVGLTEESIKAIMAFTASYKASYFKRSSVIFMSFASCGLSFSILENLQYYYIFGKQVLLSRFIICSTGHLFFSCLCGIICIKGISSKKSSSKTALFIFGGVLTAALAHGLYDFIIFKINPGGFSGLIIGLAAFFLFAVHEFWTEALKYDIQKEDTFMICTGCGAFAVGRGRFCNFCGQRIIVAPTKIEINFTTPDKT